MPLRRPRAFALVLAALGGLGAVAAAPPAAAQAAKGKAGKKDPPSESPMSAEDVAAKRRAVRGSPVDGVAPAEVGELKDVRGFEEQAFPRPPGQASEPPPSDEGRPVPLPGRWGGTGDVPEPLRTPEVSRHAAPPAAPPPGPDSDWLRSLELPALPVRWEPQVIRYLEWFKSDPRGHAIMTAWLRKLGRFRGLLERTLDAEGLPRDLVYLAMIESGFEPGGTSRVGAGGLWQFMPGVGRDYGLLVDHWTDERRDPERGTQAGARYLKDLYVRFGSWPLAFAAFHAGWGAVLKSIRNYNTNDYWELCRHEAGLPWETTLYVPKILAAAIVGHNRAAFGFGEVASDPPFEYDRVVAPGGTTLASVARAVGATPAVIAALNPEYTRERLPPDRAQLPLRIPAGTAAQFADGFERARGAADRLDTLVLRMGESLDDVAKARGLAPKDLRRLNGVKDSSDVRPGTTIVVPRREETSAAAARPDDADDDATVVAVPDRVFSYPERERVFYRTREGDTPVDIADTFHVRPEELGEWNNLDPDAKLHPRMVLQIFVQKGFDPAGVALLDPDKVRVVTLGSEEFCDLEAARRGKKRLCYVAHSGDTLAKVGKKYGLTPGDLARINRFSYNTELAAGQKIVVYSPPPEVLREIEKENERERKAAGKGGRAGKDGKDPPRGAGGKDRAAAGKDRGRAATDHAASPAGKVTPGKPAKKVADAGKPAGRKPPAASPLGAKARPGRGGK